MNVLIQSLDNEKIRRLRKLEQKKHRLEQGRFVVEGPHLFAMAKQAGRIETVFATSTEYDGNYEFHLLTPTLFAKLSEVESPQGVLAVCKMKHEPIPSDRTLLLDSIQDPGNLGTLLRSALAFGFRHVVMENSVDFYSPKVVRATQGALFDLSLEEATLANWIDDHKDTVVVGTALEDSLLLEDALIPEGPMALLLGNEGMGVRKELLDKTAFNVRIGIRHIESLNVGVAGGILMHHYRRK
jgi:TrmH family RNA methyltransferase